MKIPAMVAMLASSKVAGKKRIKSSSTGRVVMIDLPKSPCSTLTR